MKFIIFMNNIFKALYKLKNIFLAISLLICCILQSACFPTNIPISHNQRNQIKEVYLNPDIKIKRFYFPSKISFSDALVSSLSIVVFHVPAPLIRHQKNLPEKLKLDDPKIIRAIIYNQMLKQLHNSSIKVSNTKKNFSLNIIVHEYGASFTPDGHLLSNTYIPFIQIEANLTTIDNKIIWRHVFHLIKAKQGLPKHKEEELKKNPKLLLNMWNKAGEIASKKLLANLLNTLN